MATIDLERVVIGIKGAGDIASGIAVRLKKSGFSKIFMMEVAEPKAVRRLVSFSEAIYQGENTVEGIKAVMVSEASEMAAVWEKGYLGVIVDPAWTTLVNIHPDVVVDAILAKENLGTRINDAALVIGLGPGFEASVDVDVAIETMRGHNLGCVLDSGKTQANTGVPGPINGYTKERILRSPATGVFNSVLNITDTVTAGAVVGTVNGEEVVAQVGGVLRGLIRPGIHVQQGMKMGDIDPRGTVGNCFSISDKARAIGGGVLEAILMTWSKR